MKKTSVFLILISLFTIHQQANSQTKKEVSYLQQLGAIDSLFSQTLQESRNFYVELPADYTLDSGKNYPVAYILDGELLLPALVTVSQFYSGGFLPDMVLVGVSNETHRTRDLTTSAMPGPDGELNPEQGGAEAFYNFLADELIPYVEAHYPVTGYRTLIGHSYGGLFTVNTLLNHPEMFANYLAIDPSLDWDNRKLLNEASQKLETTNYGDKSLFVSLSGQMHLQKPEMTLAEAKLDTSDFTGFSRANLAFNDLLNANPQNAPQFEWKFYPNDLHGTVPLPSIMDGMISLFEWYQMEDIHKFNIPETTVAELDRILTQQAKKLEDHFGYAEPPLPDFLLNMSGYMSMDMDQPEKAKFYFEQGIKYYPNSANAYDSLADYYERTGDKAAALQAITKAYELNPDAYYKERMESLKGN